jgi:hypothetical protein
MSPSKYQPLADWLAAYAGDSVTLTFAEVADILGQPLPVTARIMPEWWTREDAWHRHISMWRALGWEVAAVDRRGHRVTFVRTAGAESS